MRHWVTYADKHYLSRLKALHASLVRHAGPFRLAVLAWDREVAEWAEHYPTTVDVTTSSEFLADHSELQPENLPGPPRSKVEHFWSCGPSWLADVVDANGEPATYIDSDIKLFSSPEPVFDEIGAARAAVFPHNFASRRDGLPGPTVETHAAFGIYNCGWVYVRDPVVAEEWAEQCRRWCFDRVSLVEAEAGAVPIGDRRLRYGDQAYLDEWPARFGAHVVQNPAAALGPWSIHRFQLERRPDGAIYYADRPLISYHYSALKLGPHGADQLTRPEYRLTDEQAALLYPDYIQEIRT